MEVKEKNLWKMFVEVYKEQIHQYIHSEYEFEATAWVHVKSGITDLKYGTDGWFV